MQSVETINLGIFEEKMNNFCLDECVKSTGDKELSEYENNCLSTCEGNLIRALELAYELEGIKVEKI